MCVYPSKSEGYQHLAGRQHYITLLITSPEQMAVPRRYLQSAKEEGGRSRTRSGFLHTMTIRGVQMENWPQHSGYCPTLSVLIMFLRKAAMQRSKSHMLDAQLHLQQPLSNLPY